MGHGPTTCVRTTTSPLRPSLLLFWTSLFFFLLFYQLCRTRTQTHTKDKITRMTFKLRYCVTCLYRTRLLYLRENNDISQVYLPRTLESQPLVYDYASFFIIIKKKKEKYNVNHPPRYTNGLKNVWERERISGVECEHRCNYRCAANTSPLYICVYIIIYVYNTTNYLRSNGQHTHTHTNMHTGHTHTQTYMQYTYNYKYTYILYIYI